MTSGELLTDMIKVGVTTMIAGKMSKVIGEKDISEMINGCGLMICGIDLILLVKPVITGIQKTCEFLDSIGKDVHAAGEGVRAIMDKLMFWR